MPSPGRKTIKCLQLILVFGFSYPDPLCLKVNKIAWMRLLTIAVPAPTGFLTCHVLDTAQGQPARGMRITLHRIQGSEKNRIICQHHCKTFFSFFFLNSCFPVSCQFPTLNFFIVSFLLFSCQFPTLNFFLVSFLLSFINLISFFFLSRCVILNRCKI